MHKLQLKNRRFGRLLVLREAINTKRVSWECRCDCGNIALAVGAELTYGHKKSCGCLKREYIQTKHGLANKTSEYGIWKGMKQRCYNPKSTFYRLYGGRGIVICARWKGSFEAFISAMGYRPSTKHSIDRIDNNGPYAPENCRWATPDVQAGNAGRNTWLTLGGVSRILEDWSRILDINASTICWRLKHGRTVEEALLS